MSSLAFDDYASSYDEHFTRSAIGVLQRERVWHELDQQLKPEMDVLEINCGTGEDAVHIARTVTSVLATDISESMIAVAREKGKDLENLDIKRADLRELPGTLSKRYDLLFSNFGGLNCISPEEIKAFSSDIAPFIKPGGRLVLVPMSRKCAWENIIFIKQKDLRYARRRSPGAIRASIGGNDILTWYYSPSELKKLFSGEFDLQFVRPVGLFVPPSYMNPWFASRRLLLRMLSWLDILFSRFGALSDYSDHYMIVLKKK